MNTQNSIKQYEKVVNALLQQKEAEYAILEKIDINIKRKQMIVMKMNQYRRDYQNFDNNRLSHQLPTLHVNLSHFIDKMQQTIESEERAIVMAKKDRQLSEKRLMTLAQKIKAMELLLSKKVKMQRVRLANTEATAEDEMATLNR